jgi:hypothetical protein
MEARAFDFFVMGIDLDEDERSKDAAAVGGRRTA